jgi:hypothetical protein
MLSDMFDSRHVLLIGMYVKEEDLKLGVGLDLSWNSL